MKKPSITVYIPSHNYGDYLQDSIESVLRQTMDDWELLIIDDGSDDDTSEIMNLYKGDDRIKLFRTEGIGLPSICNLALSKASGKYLIRLDGDDVFDENILLVLSNYLERKPDIAMVFPDYYLIDEFGEIYSEKRRSKISEKNYLLDVPANGACTLVRKKVLEGVGGYREDLGAQDGYDIWSKIIKSHKCANINLPLFYYRRHQNNLTNNQAHMLAARRRIKLDSIAGQLNDMRPIIAVIPCRKNFDFCPDLWREKIGDKTLLQRDIEKCVSSTMLDYIVVTSDNHEVKDVMGAFSDKRLFFIERRKEDTIRSEKLVSTLEKVAMKFDSASKGITTLSYIQSPFVDTATLEESISTLIINRADCSIGVEEIQSPVYKKTPHGLQMVNPLREPSVDFDIMYRETSASLAARNANFRTGSLTGPKIVNFVISNEDSFFLNSQMNLEIARQMYLYRMKNPDLVK